MRITPTALPEVLILEPPIHVDARGSLVEIYSRETFEAAGLTCPFVQDNHSHSRAGVLRGLHYQLGPGQAKLLRVLRGRVLDVAVDLRRGSRTFGSFIQIELSDQNGRSLFIPAGHAHAFYVFEEADILYKCSDHYCPALERGLRWNDPTLAIPWPDPSPLLSDRDAALPLLTAIQDLDLPEP